jgi:DNA-binding MarR family transcriptional regulator
MTDLTVLQAVRLKGRVQPAALAATLDADSAEVTAAVERLGAAGLLVVGTTIRITPDGRARLEEMLADERSGADHARLAGAYADFRGVNAAFKALVSDWQLKDGAPNPHDDPAYDTAVLDRLGELHHRTAPILAEVCAQLPRLAAYERKLSDALSKVVAGELSWLTSPVVDSYHTVWFELHEELIAAVGLTREQEAEAGHA